MNTCDTCRLWDSPTTFVAGIKFISELGVCRNKRLLNFYNNRPIGSPSVSKPDDAKIANLEAVGEFGTGPKFGCIHWEAK